MDLTLGPRYTSSINIFKKSAFQNFMTDVNAAVKKTAARSSVNVHLKSQFLNLFIQLETINMNIMRVCMINICYFG